MTKKRPGPHEERLFKTKASVNHVPSHHGPLVRRGAYKGQVIYGVLAQVLFAVDLLHLVDHPLIISSNS